jgi:hypothetical protein
MSDFRSNDEFFAALRLLIEKWCDERRLAPLSKILPSYIGFNGLGDGWHEILKSLKAVRGLGYEAFSQADWNELNDLIRAAELAVTIQS